MFKRSISSTYCGLSNQTSQYNTQLGSLLITKQYRNLRMSVSAFTRILDDRPWIVEMTRLSRASSFVRARSDELDADERDITPSSKYNCKQREIHGW